MMALGFASSILTASSLLAKPPNTTECTAPSRAQRDPYILVTSGGGGDGDRLFDWVLSAYEHAISAEYRFFSYGDSSLLIP